METNNEQPKIEPEKISAASIVVWIIVIVLWEAILGLTYYFCPFNRTVAFIVGCVPFAGMIFTAIYLSRKTFFSKNT